MKNHVSRLALLFAVAASFFFFPAAVRAESISDFHSRVTVNPDASIKVVETIQYDFGSASKHGITRTIPTVKTNQDGKKYRFSVTVVSVTDKNAIPYRFVTSYSGPKDDLLIRVGDADTFVTGEKTYVITYFVTGAITYFSEHDELYWNMVGDGSPVPSYKASYEVELPANIPADGIRQSCFTGRYGSSAASCKTSSSGNVLTGASTSVLSAGEGLTAVVGFPPGYVAHVEPQAVVDFFDTPIGKIVLVIIIILGIIWYIGLPISIPVIWWKYGRDPNAGSGPVSAWFDPPQDRTGRKLTPGETGMLVDETVDMRDIFASIIYLAQRGYIKIVEKAKNDFYFIKQKEYLNDSTVQDFEMKLLSGIFSGSAKSLGMMDIVSDVANAVMNKKAKAAPGEVRIKTLDMSENVNEATNMLYEGMTKTGFFPRNPQSIRTTCYVLAGVAAFTGNVFLAIELVIFGRIMPRKTLFGVQQANIGKSLKNFLSTQERQLEFQAKNQMFFEKLLPYAIAFGVEKVWADRFKDIELRSPDWYQGYNGRAFTTAYFLSSMNSSFSTFRTSATPTRSSSGFSSGFGGGGFSGGGGGGGSVGSW